MDAVASQAVPKTKEVSRTIDWFAVVIFGLVWLELASRLRFEWSINPQYGYGWAVPLVAAYVFWRRWENAPAPSVPRWRVLFGAIIIFMAVLLAPIRLVQEANPDWRLLSWSMAICVAVISAAGVY